MKNRIKAAAAKNGRQQRATNPNSTAGAGAPEYDVADGAMVWVTRDKNGLPRDAPVAHFTARITRAVVVVDGLDSTRTFDIDIDIGGRTYPVRGLPAAEFASLDWVIPHTMGRGRVVCGMAPRVKDAIQFLIHDPAEGVRFFALRSSRVRTRSLMVW